mmetsp:Transcript_62348/g.103700  ORF Transcript_62348/g.103700 Transcript_62348/m.103700 type:complete len:239 (-) Transcript_62348:322-1038(-)
MMWMPRVPLFNQKNCWRSRRRQQRTSEATYHQYTLFYEELLLPWRDSRIYVLELGVDTERSLKAWDEYFSHAQVFGADISRYQSDRILQVDQANLSALRTAAAHRPWSIIIDDGSHVPTHQLNSFKVLFPVLPPGGIYIIEDIETSFWHPNTHIYGYSLRGQPDTLGIFMRAARVALNREFHCKAPKPVFSSEIDAQIGSIQFIRDAVIVRKPPKGYTQRDVYRVRQYACQIQQEACR